MMKKNRLNLFKIFTPADSIFIIGVFIGFVVVVFFDIMEFRLIGGSLAVLAALRLVIIFKERAQLTANEKYNPTTKVEFETTQKKELNVKRVVIEDFKTKFDEDKQNSPSFDEKIFSKINDVFGNKASKNPDYNKKEEMPDELEFSDELSGVNIKIRKANSKKSKEDSTPKIEIDSNLENLSIETKNVVNDINAINDVNESIKDEINKVDISNEIIDDKPKENLINKNLSIDNLKEIEDISIEQIKSSKESAANENTDKQINESYLHKNIEYDISQFIDDNEIENAEPKKEFEFYIERVLKIIRSVTSTRTALFILVNIEKRELVIMVCVTDLPNAITKQKKLPFSSDIISQIIINRKPEILSDINPAVELDLLPYYEKNVGTSSFIGVPVFLGNTISGIICADTNTNDAYDLVTVGFLGHFTKLISSLMRSYTEKFELIQAEKSLAIIKEFRNSISGANITTSDIFRNIISNLSKILEFNTLGIVAYDNEYERWMIKAITNKKSNENYLDFSVDLENSLIKDSIIHYKSQVVQITSYDIIRINNTEPKFNYGYFISVPIKSFKNNYGALFLENRAFSSNTNNELLIMEDIADSAGIALEQHIYNQFVNSQPMINSTTGIMNSIAFQKRLKEEIYRANDFNTALSLFMFQIDNYSSINNQLFDTNYDIIYHHVINIVNRFVKNYDVFGHYDDSTLSVALVGVTLQNANNWARRLRSEIASSFININKRRFNVTISGGISEYKKNESFESLINNTKTVLDIAHQKGNIIKSFS